ncbi:MAG: ABC transporter ATP-binding protein [Candidimonas sp.]|nr:MAG: ABC transporter ATP-binding protein [Candidimonas sp.]TAM25654.1 MAG: ABC transporter ATP-binding protein [Candidimonas sp.]
MGDLKPQRGKGAVELRQVTKRYGKESAVNGISATILPGEFFSLLGPSGSGKTTTLMMIAGFAGVDGGQILLDGNDIVGVPPQRRGFGMVFQNYAIFPHLNVFDNVAFPLRARKLRSNEIRERVNKTLALVQLEQYADRFARQLSGGQQQRVAIARAIVFQPSVVLMDEPLGALDKNLRFQMQLEIKEIQQRLSMTVIYVTHDQEEAMNMSDRMAIMNNGRIEQIGRANEIYENPASNFIARFLGEANLIEGTIESIQADVTVLRTDRGLRFRARTAESVSVGSRAHLFVRPERVLVDQKIAQEKASVNYAVGCLKQTSFLGNILRHSVEIEQGTRITVDVQNFSNRPIQTTDQTALSWRVEDSVILSR